jgi:uncharacterized membrane protein
VTPALALAATGWVTVLAVAPLLPVPLAAVMYLFGSLICHQLADRSFHLDGAQLPVCARCFGIYVGAALATLSRLAAGSDPRTTRPRGLTPRMMLAAGAVPTLVTVLFETMGLWSTSNVVRAVAGLPLGAAVAFVVTGAVATLHYEQCVPRRPIAPPRPPTPI